MKRWLLVCLAVLGPFGSRPEAHAAPPDSTPPADFKMHILLYGAGKVPQAKSTVVVREGRSYQFLNDTSKEVQIVEPRSGRVVLLDLKRGIQTEILHAQLEENLERLHSAIDRTASRKEGSESRSDRVAASMSRNLIDRTLRASFDASKRLLTLKNATVELSATGVSEQAAGRLRQIRLTLELLIELSALRDPRSIPPFARLESLRQLVEVHQLVPVEVTLVYRLAGPPILHRWAYDYVDTLTLDEREAIVRIERLRSTAPLLPYERYEALLREKAEEAAGPR